MIRAIDSLVGFVYFIGFCLYDPQWFMDYFVNLRADSTNYLPLQQLALGVLILEMWDVLLRLNWYDNIYWSSLILDWIIIGCCIATLRGIYAPHGIWYAFTIIACYFPVRFCEVFRSRCALQYPEVTRTAFRICYWWWIAQLILNAVGVNLLFTNSLLYHYNQSIPVWCIGASVVGLTCVSVSDYRALKILGGFASEQYELANVVESQTTGTPSGTEDGVIGPKDAGEHPVTATSVSSVHIDF